MARANPANKPQPNEAETEKKEPIILKKEPIIEYYGEGAKDVKLNIDPNATRIRVYADGRILTDY